MSAGEPDYKTQRDRQCVGDRDENENRVHDGFFLGPSDNGITWLVLRRGLELPLAHLTHWLHDLRTGSASGGPELPDKAVFGPLTEEVARLAITLTMARATADEEARLREAAETM